MKRSGGGAIPFFILVCAPLVPARELPELWALAGDVSNEGTVVPVWQDHARTTALDSRLCSFNFKVSHFFIILLITLVFISSELPVLASGQAAIDFR